MKQRLDYLDVSKGILITLVVAAHVFQSGLFCKFAYSFHMEAFFIISGILIQHTSAYKKPWKKLLPGKIFSLLIPFCFFELWGIARDLVLYGFHQNWKGFLYNTLSLNFNNGVLWFLFVLFFAELLFIAVLKLIRSGWAVALVSVGLLFVSILVPKGSLYLNYGLAIFKTVFFLWVGYRFKDLLLKTNLPVIAFAIAVLLILLFAVGSLDYHSVTFANLLFFLLGALCGTYLVLQAGKIPWLRWISVGGRNSLVIYGTHSFYYVVFGKWIGITDFTATPLLLGFADLELVIVAEFFTVYLLNRFLPFLVGKRNSARHNKPKRSNV